MASGKSQFGVVGLGVMGANLAENVEEHGFSVAVYNRTHEKTEEFLAANRGKKFAGAGSYAELAAKLERPRRILLHGARRASRSTRRSNELAPLLERGRHRDRRRQPLLHRHRAPREAELAAQGLHFVGMGVSGGEEGALKGPSIMPGGDVEACERLRPIFEAIAAAGRGRALRHHCGPDGAGHFVKMVHNGIEYGDMQLIAEAYDLLRNGLGLDAPRAGRGLRRWNEGELAAS